MERSLTDPPTPTADPPAPPTPAGRRGTADPRPPGLWRDAGLAHWLGRDGHLDRARLIRALAEGAGLGLRSDTLLAAADPPAADLRARNPRALGADDPPPRAQAPTTGFHRPTGGTRPAAVLVGLVDHPRRPTILLTRRTAHLAAHAGQVAFPGGRCEPDDPGPVATALREAREETGLDPAAVTVLGRLDCYVTVTGFLVTPVVGIAPPPLALSLDPREVAAAFEVPLAEVLTPGRLHRRPGLPGRPEAPHAHYVLTHETEHIWGATAAILMNLVAVLTRPP